MLSTKFMATHAAKFLKISEPRPHIVLAELNRKPVNAFNEEFWRELGTVFDRISADPNVRAVVLASALPKMFTAGLDLKDSATLLTPSTDDPARRALTLRAHILEFQDAISSIERCCVPVILAAHGTVMGLGVDITCACDVRYASADAVFSIKEVDIGLAADIGSLARLPKITGNSSLVSELALTARPFSAEEALAFGLVSRVISAPGPGSPESSRLAVVEAALETAVMIASKPPVAVAGTKRLLRHARDHSVEENLEYTATWNAFALQTSDVKEALTAAQTKQPPKFKNLPKL